MHYIPIKKKNSIIVPVFNEEMCIEQFLKEIKITLKKIKYEIIFVDDGSTDKTYEILKKVQKQTIPIKIIKLLKNYGKEKALLAGLSYSKGDAVISMDVDLQDPPKIILKLIEKWEEGFELVHAVRTKRFGDSLFKKLSAQFYYFLVNLLSTEYFQKNASDFKLLDQKVIKRILKYSATAPVLKISSVQFSHSQSCVLYKRIPRFSGKTKWNLSKLIKQGFDGIIFSTTVPLRV